MVNLKNVLTISSAIYTRDFAFNKFENLTTGKLLIKSLLLIRGLIILYYFVYNLKL